MQHLNPNKVIISCYGYGGHVVTMVIGVEVKIVWCIANICISISFKKLYHTHSGSLEFIVFTDRLRH